MSRLDLHLHTTHSDGSLSPTDVIGLAHNVRVTALAITDHDIVSGIPEAITAGAELGIEIIPGVEISSSVGNSELHILGYCLRWQDQELNRRLAVLRESRHNRNPQIIERLRSLGLDVTYEEVRTLAGTESVGRPHIARLLMDKKYVTSAKDAFDRYLAEGRPAYVARELPTPADAIAWIRAAGGVAVLAHPTWAKVSGEGLNTLVTTLKSEGLGGVEVHYSTHTKRQTAEYLDMAKRLNLLVTGGSDFHGITKPDIEVGLGRGDLKVPERLLGPLKEAAMQT
jgi:predicted metal-dependent phosphoesterase TrpH